MKTLGLLVILSVLGVGLSASGCKDTPAATEAGSGPYRPLAPGTPPRPPTPAPAEGQPVDARPLVVCFGDSLTAGYGTEPGESYPDALQRLLDERGYNYRVVNQGISGNTTKDGLDRVERVMARHPKIVVVEFGGNDGLRGLPLEQTQANLSSIIERLQKGNSEVALAGITLPPDYGQDYIAKVNAIYPALAKKYHVRLLPFLLQGVYGVPGDMQEDHTHATAKGNKQVAANVEKLVEPLLRK